MKKIKILTAALSAASVLALSLGLTACEDHVHDWADALSKNDTSHWYACSGCDEKKDEAPHDFTSGDCVCGQKAPQPIIPEITAEDWSAAFENLTAFREYSRFAIDNGTYSVVKYDGVGTIYLKLKDKPDRERINESFYVKSGNEYTSYTTSTDDEIWTRKTITERQYQRQEDELLCAFPAVRAMKDHYSAFEPTYDAATQTITLSAETLTVTVAETETTLLNVSAKFTDGELVSCSFTTEGGKEATCYEYTFEDVTEPIPETYVTQIDSATWTAAFEGLTAFREYSRYAEDNTTYAILTIDASGNFYSECKAKPTIDRIDKEVYAKDGENFYAFECSSEDEVWTRTTITEDSFNIYKSKLIDMYNCVKAFKDHFADFKSAYDAEAKALVFSAETLTVTGEYGDDTFTSVRVSFKDGKLVSCSLETEDHGKGSSLYEYTFTDVTVEIPENFTEA